MNLKIHLINGLILEAYNKALQRALITLSRGLLPQPARQSVRAVERERYTPVIAKSREEIISCLK